MDTRPGGGGVVTYVLTQAWRGYVEFLRWLIERLLPDWLKEPATVAVDRVDGRVMAAAQEMSTQSKVIYTFLATLAAQVTAFIELGFTLELFNSTGFDADSWSFVALTLYGEDTGSIDGYEAVATTIKNRKANSPSKYKTYYDVVTEGNDEFPNAIPDNLEMKGVQYSGLNNARKRIYGDGQVEFIALVGAYKVSYRLVTGQYINPHGLTSAYTMMLARGYSSPYIDTSSRISVGANDFYKPKS